MPSKKQQRVDVLKYKKLQWTNVIHVEEEGLELLRKKYKFHHLDLEDCLSETQRPKIDEYEHYLFIVLHLPYYDRRRKAIQMIEVDVFMGKNFLITAHDEHSQLEDIFEKCKAKLKTRKEYFSKGSGFLLYMILDDLFEGAFPLLDKMGLTIVDLEKDVFNLMSQRELLKDILMVKKDIITFRQIILPQRVLLAQLEHKIKRFVAEDLELYFDDVVDKVEKIWSNLENYRDLLQSLQETHESLLSYRTNNIVKILTIFSVIMLPLTFITGLYGMNIEGIPLASDNTSFYKIAFMMASVVVTMFGYFRYKKWL